MKNKGFDRRRHPEGAHFSEWRAPDGWVHRRMDWPQADRAEPRGSLLFAGGRGDFIEKYLEAQAHWHTCGWNITSFDWRGQGASRGDIVGGHLDSLEPLVDDLAAFVAEWKAETPGPHVVVAHSMGGHVLLRVLAEACARLDAAVLVAPMLQVNSGPLPSLGAWWTSSLVTAFGGARLPIWSPRASSGATGSQRQSILTSDRERYEDELWWWEQQPGFDLGAPSWGWLSAAYQSCAAITPDRLATIGTPLLFVGTDADRLVSASEIRRVAGLIPGAEIKMFADAAHEILRESDAVRLEALERIDSFFEAKAPAR